MDVAVFIVAAVIAVSIRPFLKVTAYAHAGIAARKVAGTRHSSPIIKRGVIKLGVSEHLRL